MKIILVALVPIYISLYLQKLQYGKFRRGEMSQFDGKFHWHQLEDLMKKQLYLKTFDCI